MAMTTAPEDKEQSSSSLLSLHQAGHYVDVVCSPVGSDLVREAVGCAILKHAAGAGQKKGEGQEKGEEEGEDSGRETPASDANHHDRLVVGLAALDAFLQANVTGPVLERGTQVEALFCDAFAAAGAATNSDNGTVLKRLRKACLASLEVEGVAPYPHVPHIELFCLARHLLVLSISSTARDRARNRAVALASDVRVSPAWMRLRVNTWHYKLLTQPSFSAGAAAAATRSTHWSDVPSLVGKLVDGIDTVRRAVVVGAGGEGQVEEVEVWDMTGGDVQEGEDDGVEDAVRWTTEEKVQCLVELANVNILLGREEAARTMLDEAVATSGVEYVLTGALGKRTRFQERDVSQLVVLAKSRGGEEEDGEGKEGKDGKDGDHEDAEDAGPKTRPDAVALNDDTLLEKIAYNTTSDKDTAQKETTVPPSLATIEPGNQPQLSLVDQIILLAEATLRDSFSTADSLTLEEVLPYAVRVLADDKDANWQIYTQALLVRSRIEVHRSRTVERGVLQMQAVVDQVVVDTTGGEQEWDSRGGDGGGDDGDGDDGEVPVIAVTAPDATTDHNHNHNKPTTFFRAPKKEESAPARARLQYIHTLSSPPRWHLESELGFAWAHVGSLVSALDIFKRLHLWAEVALCLATASAAAEESGDGRGAGGDAKARAILRWRLFTRTGTPDPPPESYPADPDDDVPPTTDPATLAPSAFTGPLRQPPPPNAPRLLCILGDVEEDPAHYELAWRVSSGRFARAQKALGEHHARRADWAAAKTAFELAVRSNRLNPELWGRLGDMCLRLGQFAGAAGAYGRAVAAAGEVDLGGEDARTWSNLGSALWSLYRERVAKEEKKRKEEDEERDDNGDGDNDDDNDYALPLYSKDPSALLTQALAAYKRGATIAHSNWRIWDNVLTLAARMQPPALGDMILATRQLARLRSSEKTFDADILRAMVHNAVLSRPADAPRAPETLPARGTPARAVVNLIEDVVVPLITRRADLWELVWRERAWRGDFRGAVDAAEKAWRAELGGAGGTLGGGGGGGEADAEEKKWLVDVDAWRMLVRRTEELVSVLENWGSRPECESGLGERKWRVKARSAVRSVMGKARASWEGGEEWGVLEAVLEGLR